MNKTLRKIRHDAKALSPVVASIILIAVTVAVSIAVAAWMGGMTVGFMGSSSVTVTNVDFSDQDHIVLDLKNTGTKTVTVAAVRLNNQLQTANWAMTVNGTTTKSMNAGDTGQIDITYTWAAGNPYKVNYTMAATK